METDKKTTDTTSASTPPEAELVDVQNKTESVAAPKTITLKKNEPSEEVPDINDKTGDQPPDTDESPTDQPAEEQITEKPIEIPPPLSGNKILENKRKIVTRTRAKDTGSAVSLFFDTFSSYYPADLEFLNTFFTELTRINDYECFYTIIQKTSEWYKDNDEYALLSSNVTKLYIDNLILQGNNFIFERNERIEHIKRNTRRGDVNRDKKNFDNDKLLGSFCERALEAFEKAYNLAPDSLPALNGLKNCYDFAGDFENLEKVLTAIEKLLMKKRGIVVEETEVESAEAKQEAELAAFNQFHTEFTAITQLFNDERNDEFLEFFDEINNPERPYIPLILLKARVLARIRKFKESDELIKVAEKENSHFPELNEAKSEIKLIKHRLYRKAGTYYLERALHKGITFGKLEFFKAKEAIENAIYFVDDDIELYNQYYTVLKYLRLENEAFKIKGIIYSMDPSYTTSFDKQLNSKMCFIASYAYADEPNQVDLFRWFRREFLLSSQPGRAFNCFYIRHSPRLVKLAQKIPFSKLFFKTLLFLPLIAVKTLKTIFDPIFQEKYKK